MALSSGDDDDLNAQARGGIADRFPVVDSTFPAPVAAAATRLAGAHRPRGRAADRPARVHAPDRSAEGGRERLGGKRALAHHAPFPAPLVGEQVDHRRCDAHQLAAVEHQVCSLEQLVRHLA